MTKKSKRIQRGGTSLSFLKNKLNKLKENLDQKNDEARIRSWVTNADLEIEKIRHNEYIREKKEIINKINQLLKNKEKKKLLLNFLFGRKNKESSIPKNLSNHIIENIFTKIEINNLKENEILNKINKLFNNNNTKKTKKNISKIM